MANEEPKYSLNSQPIADNRRILLLDANSNSRGARTKALRDRGAHVDCVAGAEDARTVWKPGSHEIVLIDFRNAGEEMRDFYRYACVKGRKQKFGFYVDGPPYVTRSHSRCEPASATIDCSPPGELAAFAQLECEDDNFQTGLREAARRIATVRRLTRPGAASGGAQLRGIPASEAMRIASRVLGGEC
jgi:hypothetical protein